MSFNKSTTSVASIFDCNRYDSHTNATSVAVSPDHSISSTNHVFHDNDYHNASKNIILLVGLPATGKSTISKMLTEHLNTYTPYKAKIFNCGKVRRQSSNKFYDYQFFDPNDEISKFKRDMIAMNTLNALIDELSDNTINVGILDATNTTIERRSSLVHLISEKTATEDWVLDNLIILDVQCPDPKLVKYNIISKTTNDDYKDQEFQKSIDDFSKRLELYKQAYQPINDHELQSYDELSAYIRIENGNHKYEFRNRTKNEFLELVENYFMGYCNYESVLYRKAVDEFYDKIDV